jgi:long-chain acyl-CoA synthetase
MVFGHAEAYPDDVIFSRKVAGEWEPVTTKDFAASVRSVAAGLVAAGVSPGDRVALMSRTRYEWTLCDYAIWTAGAVTVPIYETSSAEQVAWILSDSGAALAIVESAKHRELVAQAADTSSVRAVFEIETGGIDDLIAQGQDVIDTELESRRTAVTPEELATVIYTSGTTGRPKGCELTHGNLLFELQSTAEGLRPLFVPGSSTLLFLPLAHVLARVIQCGCVYNRVRMGHAPDIKNLLSDLGTFRPTFILSVPRVFEKVYNTAKQKARDEGKGRIFDLAESTAVAYSEALDRGRVSPLLRARHLLFDKLVYGKLRAALGGQTKYAVSGGAPLGVRLGHFYRGIGLTILEGYGLTETSAAATLNLPSAMKVGTVGRPIPGASVRIAEDGEVLLKGGHIFAGYWKNEDATADVLHDGYLRTGDIGVLDADGFLTITGRKKELIVTAGGKNVAPAVLEDRLRAHPLISQCMVVGDKRPFIGVLITLDEEALPGWSRAHGKPENATAADLVDDPDLRAELQKAVDEANKAVSHAESIRKFVILPVDFTEENGALTPSLKVKRNVVLDRFGDDVENLYTR